jgi:Apea-like HEPN
MIALEILLGDKQRSDLMGLSELLRNRCAYLIGKNQRQRESILDDFGRIYDVRSQIVHRGKSRLSRQEQYLFFRLRWMCFRVIQEEVRLLEADTI